MSSTLPSTPPSDTPPARKSAVFTPRRVAAFTALAAALAAAPAYAAVHSDGKPAGTSNGYGAAAPAAGHAASGSHAQAAAALITRPAWSKKTATLTARLTGDQEVGTIGALAASASITIRLDPETGRAEFRDVKQSNLLAPEGETLTNLHIHRGAKGTAGGVVVDFTPALESLLKGEVAADKAVVAQILADPAGFYVNMHTQAFPKGAVRGQLQAQAPSSRKAVILQATMTGAQEVGTVGSATGRATVVVRLDPTTGRVAFRRLRVRGLAGGAGDTVTKLHIHRGVAGTAGDVVIDFTSVLGDGSGGSVDADPALVQRIVANPGNWYVNVHTTAFPKGAVRGQLGGCMTAW